MDLLDKKKVQTIKYTVAERAQHAANIKNTKNVRKQLWQFYNTRAANAHNTTKKRNAL